MEESGTVWVGGIPLAVDYANFHRGQLTDNERETPGLGYTVAYHGGDNGEATVFVYTKGRDNIPDGPMSDLVRDEFNQATREILSLGQTVGRTTQLVSRYGTGSPDSGIEFLCAEFVLTDRLGSRRTFVFVTASAGKYVKVRVTLRTNDATDPQARKFADALALDLRRTGTK